jgi:hypothetical protein
MPSKKNGMNLTEFGSTGRHYLVFKDQKSNQLVSAAKILEPQNDFFNIPIYADVSRTF